MSSKVNKMVVVVMVSALTMLDVMLSMGPAQANITQLRIGRRSCGTLTAYVTYDSFSEGQPAFYAVVAVDLNGNGIFGEQSEPVQYIRVKPGGGNPVEITTSLGWDLIPAEGSTIAVTSYEVDSAGNRVSAQLPPISYVCSHRPAYKIISDSQPGPIPQVGVTVKITAEGLPVYSGASTQTKILDGIAQGDSANVIGLNRRGDWAEVSYHGFTGWILWKGDAIMFGPYKTLPVLPNYEDGQSN